MDADHATCDDATDTLRIGCTDLTAVPHAGLRNQILKNQVRGPERL